MANYDNGTLGSPLPIWRWADEMTVRLKRTELPRSHRPMLRLAMSSLIVAGVCGAIVVGISAARVAAEAQSSSNLSLPELVPSPPANLNDKPAGPRYIGAGSCAARACHGSPTLTPGREWNSAYAIWTASDPHSQAYAVLFTPESRRMATVLGVGDPWKADRCLACHSAPVSGSRAHDAMGDAASIMSDGVSCEVCHGPAEKYLAAHTMTTWNGVDAGRREKEFGMKNTANIAARAEVCVGCHVGQPDADGRPWRDVNHDLIAAGHPRLNFDYAAYIATLPPHWNIKKDPQKFEELHSWLIGQFVASQQALKLLNARATAAQSIAEPSSTDAKHPIVNPAWPELAELDCFACHHGLSGANWRQNAAAEAANPHDGRPPRKPGTPAWGTWYYTSPELIANTAALTPGPDGAELRKRLNELTKSMQTPVPDPARVAQQTSDGIAQIEICRQAALAHLSDKPSSAENAALRRQIIESLAAQFQQHKPESWDEFVQYYLALVAIYKSDADAKSQSADGILPQSQRKQLLNLLETIRNRLSFSGDVQVNSPETNGTNKISPILRVLRSGFNSPFEFDPFATPRGVNPNEVASKNLFQLFDEVFSLLSSSPAR